MSEYIDREAAIKAVSENDCEGYATWAVKAIPAADVRPVKRGHWIHLSRGDVCSECGFDTGRYSIGRNYCPNCGAEMREEQT